MEEAQPSPPQHQAAEGAAQGDAGATPGSPEAGGATPSKGGAHGLVREAPLQPVASRWRGFG